MPKLMELAPSDPRIIIDPRVQRPFDATFVKRKLPIFRPDSLGVLVGSLRPDGAIALSDGQHRRELAIAAEYPGKLQVLVHTGLSLEEEASLFLELNDRKDVPALDKFRVRITQGDKAANDINDILIRHGWRLAGGANPGTLSAVVTLERIYDGKYGLRAPFEGQRADLVETVINIVTRAWGNDPQGASQIILAAIGMLMHRRGRVIDEERLVGTLRKNQPIQVIAQGKQYHALVKGSVPAATAKFVVGQYNLGLRANRLPDWEWTK